MMRIEWMEEEEAGWINYGRLRSCKKQTRANCVQRRTAGIKMDYSGFQPWREAKAKDPNWKKNVCMIGKGFPRVGSRVTRPKTRKLNVAKQTFPTNENNKISPPSRPFFNLTAPPQVQRGTLFTRKWRPFNRKCAALQKVLGQVSCRGLL